MIDIVKVVNEGVETTEKTPVVVFLNYEFHEKLYIGGAIKNSGDVEIVQDRQDSKYITGFIIEVQVPTDPKINAAKEKGTLLLHYLSSKTGFVVRSKRPSITKVAGNKLQQSINFTTNAIVSKNIDLDLGSVSSTLQGNANLNKRIAGFRNGLVSFTDNEFEMAVQGFFQVLENTGTKEENHFRPLRHACSHQKIDNDNTIRALASDFGIRCTKGMPVNFNDPDNWNQLSFHANELKSAATRHIDPELKRLKI